MNTLLAALGITALFSHTPVQNQGKPQTPKRQIVIAHRGASAYLPEHTLPAIAMAYQMGADFIEPDCVLSKDNIPIVVHDTYIDTISDVATKYPTRKRKDGRFYAIDFTLAELKTLAISERFDPTTGKAVFPNRFPIGIPGFTIPTLAEEIELIQGLNKSTGKNIGIYPEIKNPEWHRSEGRDISKAVIDVLWKYGYKTKADKCYVQCFDFAETKRLRNELGWNGLLIQLTTPNADKESSTDYDKLLQPSGLDEIAKVADGIGPWINQLIEGVVDGKLKINAIAKNAKARGLQVHPYTARYDALPTFSKTFDELLQAVFVDVGADGIFSDHPDKVVVFVRKLNRKAQN